MPVVPRGWLIALVLILELCAGGELYQAMKEPEEARSHSERTLAITRDNLLLAAAFQSERQQIDSFPSIPTPFADRPGQAAGRSSPERPVSSPFPLHPDSLR